MKYVWIIIFSYGYCVWYCIPMYIDIVPNRSSPPAVLLREDHREGGRTIKRTLANLSALPPEAVAALRAVL